MSILRTVGGWGVVLLGTVVMGVGYVLSLSTPLSIGKTTTETFGKQLTDMGFTLVVAGFAAWLIVYFLRELDII